MDDLWFDVAIRGEPGLQDDVDRFRLLDGAEPDGDRDAERPAQPAQAADRL